MPKTFQSVRDLLFEEYPPPFSAEDEVTSLRDGLIEKLKKLRWSDRKIEAVGKSLAAMRGNMFEISARRALFFAARFRRAVKEKNWPVAAYYSFQVGRSAQNALADEAMQVERGWTHLAKRKNDAAKKERLRQVVLAKLDKKRGLTSAAEVFNHCAIEKDFGMKLRNFQNWWTKAGITELHRRIRESFISGPKRDLRP